MSWKRDESTPTDPIPVAGVMGADGNPQQVPAGGDGDVVIEEHIADPTQFFDHMVVDFANMLMKGTPGAEDSPLGEAFGKLVAAYCQKYPNSEIARQVAMADG